jgi:flavin reductase (DIM6/NTAB) family NADH-FMN oxidoreductase RutF
MESNTAQLSHPGADEFRRVLGHFPTGMVAITACDEDEPVGVAIGSFASISLEPRLVGFFIDRDSSTWPRIERAGAFAVNVLGERHAPLCQRFARRGADRFAGVAWSPGADGAPLLDDALAWIECDIAEVLEAGDHWLVVGAVRRLQLGSDGRPLVFCRGELAALEGEAA